MDFISIYNIKQYSPHINFQKDQSGFKLRVSEIKPRLDSFIRTYIKDDFKDDLKNKMIFSYKLKITQSESNKINFDQKEPVNFQYESYYKFSKNYFANIGTNNKEPKDFCFYNNIKFKFILFNKNSENIIKEFLPYFLLTTNFGNRQSKGFGSFFISDTDSNGNLFSDKYINTEKLLKNLKIFYIKDIEIKEQLNIINRLSLRTINNQNTLKFLIMKKFLEKNSKKEFRSILKESISKNGQKNSNLQSSDCLYLYDLFGYKSQDLIAKNFKIIKKDPSNKIERIPSPFYFKPLDNTLLLIFKSEDFTKLFKNKDSDELCADKIEFNISKEEKNEEKNETFLCSKDLYCDKDNSLSQTILETIQSIPENFSYIKNFEDLKDLFRKESGNK
jgi:hypothetical protein